MLWSLDFDQSNEHEYLNSNFDLSKLKPTLNNISKLENSNQKCYLLHPINFHFDKLQYKNLFESLKNLKRIITEKDFVLVFPVKHTNIKSYQLYEMLEFIFSNKTNHISTTPYHPQMNGGLESSHHAMFSYNASTRTSTKYSPFMSFYSDIRLIYHLA